EGRNAEEVGRGRGCYWTGECSRPWRSRMPVLSWPAVLRLVVAVALGISIWTAALPGPSTQAGAVRAAPLREANARLDQARAALARAPTIARARSSAAIQRWHQRARAARCSAS